MVRRKKSLLFSVSLASAGLVAGALFIAAPKSQATGEELSAKTTEAKIQQISEETDIPSSVVKDSLKTHKLILGISDEKELDDNDDVVDYKKVAEGVYVVVFKDYDTTSDNYHYYKNSDKAESVDLNIPLTIIDDNVLIPANQNGADYSRCIEARSTNTTTHTNFTRLPDQCLGWGAESMKLFDYAKSIQDAQEVTVAVLDTGIRATHDAFSYSEDGAKDRLKTSLAYDYVDDDNDPDDSNNDFYKDNEGNVTEERIQHGTTVAGTITESTPYNVKVVPVRVTSGRSLYLDVVAEAVSGLKGKVDIINLSLGSVNKIAKPYNSVNAAIDKVFKEAKEAGTIIVAATGNAYADGSDFVSYPASSDYTIAVGAVNSTNTITSFSQRGSEVDFTAPGESILLPYAAVDNGVALSSGTSFATPYISAAIANILSEHPDYSFDDVYNELKLNTDDLGSAGKDNIYGHGSVSFRVNKYADLNVAKPTTSDNWTNQGATLTVTISSNGYNVTHYAINSGNTTKTAPSSWTAVATPAKVVTISEPVSNNGIYTIWTKNDNNEISAETFTISNIDKAAPVISTGFEVSNITNNSATLSVEVKDADSGLDKIVWHYKAENDDEYTDETDNFNGETEATTKTLTLNELENGSTYTAYATIYDIAGNTKNTPEITFVAADGNENITTDGDENQPTTSGDNTGTDTGTDTNTNNTTTNASSTTKPKTTKASATIKNPQTADINLPAIAGIGTVLSAAAFFIFRAKRR